MSTSHMIRVSEGMILQSVQVVVHKKTVRGSPLLCTRSELPPQARQSADPWREFTVPAHPTRTQWGYPGGVRSLTFSGPWWRAFCSVRFERGLVSS